MLIPLLLPLALAALLEQAPPPVLDAVVSVASRSAQPAREVAGTVSVIERERLDQTLVQDLADLTRYEPGLSAPEDATRFGVSGLAIRGLSGNRVAMELDGVALADGFAIGSFSNAGRAAVEPAFLSRLEILRGPASTLYGSDALAGVVSMRTLSVDELLKSSANVGMRVEGHALTRDGSTASNSLSGWKPGPFELLVGVVRRQGGARDNMPRPGGLSSNPAERDEHSELIKLGFDGAQLGRYGLMVNRTQERVVTDVRSLIAGPGQYATTTALFGDDVYQSERLSSSGQWSINAVGLDDLSATVYRQRSRTDQDTSQTRAAVAPRTPATMRERNFLLKTQATGINLQAQGRFDALGARHWQVYGIEYARTALNELRDAREINLANGAVTHLIIGERFPVRDFPPSTMREFGAYWQDEIRLGDSALTLIPGVRYEHYRVNSTVDTIFAQDNPGLIPVDLAEAQFTPKLGARLELNAHQQLFAQYAVGFRAPPVADVNIGFTIPSFNYIAIPNPDLRPERSRGLELGLRSTLAFASLEIVAFDNHYRDLIESRVNLGRDPISGALVFQSINRDRAHIYGLEVRGDVDLPWDGFALQGALAWTRGDDSARDVPLNSVEPAKLTLGIAYTAASGQHRLELMTTAVAAKTRIDDPNDQLFRTPGFATLDAYWNIQVADRLVLNLGAFNLTNRRHWLWSGVRGLPANAREIDLYSQPGRQFGASVRYSF